MKKTPFALTNVRLFVLFRLFFNARFYYPVFTILFLDYGLTIEQFAILNAVWAATIVVAEVPSGALADLIGRKQLLLTTTILMICEMALIGFVPLADITLVFWAFLLNRILSGLAGAMASGADEALAYDTLKDEGMEDEWPRVLSITMRTNSLGSLITMSFGALIYDPDIVNRFLAFMDSSQQLSQQQTMRFPILLTLCLGVLALITVVCMKETQTEPAGGNQRSWPQKVVTAMKITLQAGTWILRTPFALVIILFAMMYDHILRMVITMTSQFFRLILLPEASFGVIGASMSFIGLFLPKLAEKMVARFTPLQNMLWLTLITMIALVGNALFIPYFGVLFLLFVSSGLMLTNFFTSHYLNRITDSDRRATVLSFKGLAYNLAYGFIGMAFAALMAATKTSQRADTPGLDEIVIENLAFKAAIPMFIPYALLAIGITALISRFLLKGSRHHNEKG